MNPKLKQWKALKNHAKTGQKPWFSSRTRHRTPRKPLQSLPSRGALGGMVSFSLSGRAMGKRPLGATSPKSTEAQAEPVASPPRKSASRCVSVARCHRNPWVVGALPSFNSWFSAGSHRCSSTFHLVFTQFLHCSNGFCMRFLGDFEGFGANERPGWRSRCGARA